MTKEPKQPNGAKIAFSTNGSRITGHPHVKKKKEERITSRQRPQKI